MQIKAKDSQGRGGAPIQKPKPSPAITAYNELHRKLAELQVLFNVLWDDTKLPKSKTVVEQEFKGIFLILNDWHYKATMPAPTVPSTTGGFEVIKEKKNKIFTIMNFQFHVEEDGTVKMYDP